MQIPRTTYFYDIDDDKRNKIILPDVRLPLSEALGTAVEIYLTLTILEIQAFFMQILRRHTPDFRAKKHISL